MEMIDDEYWLGYAKNSVEKSITSRNEAAGKLQNMVLWFWGLYTASFTIGVSLQAVRAPYWVLLLLASPIVLLIVTYWFCVLAQLPVNASFDPSIPYEIKRGYNVGLVVKTKRFTWALVFTFISALCLGAALFSFSLANKKDDISLQASWEEKEKTIIISGSLPEGITAYTTIDTIDANKNKNTIFSNVFQVQKTGVLSLNIPVKEQPRLTLVTVTWMEDGEQKGLARMIEK